MLQTEQLTINIGPQHPSAHGGLHVEAVLDGEMVTDAIVHLGYVHRSVEKMCIRDRYWYLLIIDQTFLIGGQITVMGHM